MSALGLADYGSSDDDDDDRVVPPPAQVSEVSAVYNVHIEGG